MVESGKRKPAKKKAAEPKKRTPRVATSPAPEPVFDPTPITERIDGRHETEAPVAADWQDSATPTGPEVVLQLVTFVVDDEEYGFPIMRVQEILRSRTVHVTPIPNAPLFVEGVMNLRGRVIPVVGLRRRFGMPDRERDRSARVIVVEVAGRTLAVSVDAVVEVATVDATAIEPLPELASTERSEYIIGVSRAGDRMVIVLDMDRVFSAEEKATLDNLTAGTRGEASCI